MVIGIAIVLAAAFAQAQRAAFESLRSLGGKVRPCFLLEGSSAVLEEFLLPAVDRRLESHFIAQLRD
jgi:hypothetical protein